MAVQGAKGAERENFGKGEIKGVIAPESANNASAGGELVPLLAFGVPGGATSAILLAAFLILGINPGPEMLGENLALSFSMVIVLVLSNCWPPPCASPSPARRRASRCSGAIC